MIYGYARVSTKHQSLARQERNIKREYPDAFIIKEKFSGRKMENRKEWQRLMRIVKKGDTIIFDSVSRMSRNEKEGFETYFSLYEEKGINLVFLKEPSISTKEYQQNIDQVFEMRVSVDGDKASTEMINNILKEIATWQKKKVKETINNAFAQSEAEVLELSRRTKEGIVTARLNGMQIGAVKGQKNRSKKKEYAIAQIKKKHKMFGGYLNDTQCIAECKVSPASFYNYKKELKEQFTESKT